MKDDHWGHWWTEWMKWVFFERTTQRVYTITGLQSSGFPHQLKWFYSLSVLAVYTGYRSKGKKGSTEARWRTKDQTAVKRDAGGVSLLTVPPPHGGDGVFLSVPYLAQSHWTVHLPKSCFCLQFHRLHTADVFLTFPSRASHACARWVRLLCTFSSPWNGCCCCLRWLSASGWALCCLNRVSGAQAVICSVNNRSAAWKTCSSSSWPHTPNGKINTLQPQVALFFPFSRFAFVCVWIIYGIIYLFVCFNEWLTRS